MRIFAPLKGPDGEIGRHATLRGWCRYRCASSSLVLGTIKKETFSRSLFCCISLGIKGLLLPPHRWFLAVRATLHASSQATRCQGYHITSSQATRCQGHHITSSQVTRKRLVRQIPSLMPTTPPNSPNLHLQPQVKNVPIPQNPSTEHTKRFLPKPTRLTSWGGAGES